MSINLKVPDVTELKPRITVVGAGGAGGNAVNNMIASGLEGVQFVVANTDAQALAMSRAERRIQMGAHVTEGLGAGSKPEIGAAAAEEALADIKAQLSNSHMVFITAGMGGGTGTGAAPVIARAAREEGILTVGVVTKPFQFEGQRRMRIADSGITELAKQVDTLIVIPNQNLFRVATEKTTFADAFALADQVLHSGVACITDLMVKEGLINLDFADVKTIMKDMGKAMMGTGQASGEQRAIEAAEAAISNPLLDDVSMKGAAGLLISITGGSDLTLYEVDEAASRIREEVDQEANIILGATFDSSLDGQVRVSVVATGIGTFAQKDAVTTAAPATVAQPQTMRKPARLSDRIEQMSEAQPAASAPAPLPAALPAARPQQPPRPSADEVMIEKQRPRPVHLAPLTGGAAKQAAAQSKAEPFAPQKPVTAKRPARRMPSMDELPITAQNELRARDGGDSVLGLQAQKKKIGFFERLAGVGRSRKEEPAEPQRDREPRLDPIRPLDSARPQAQPVPKAASDTAAPSKARLMRQAGAAKPQGPTPVSSGRKEDDLEIPAFLRRQAN